MDLRIAISTWDAPPAIGGPPRYIEELVKRLSNYIDIVLLVPSYASVKEKNGLEIRKIGSRYPYFKSLYVCCQSKLSCKKDRCRSGA